MKNGKDIKLERLEKKLSQVTAQVILVRNRNSKIDKNRATRRRLLAGDYLFKLLGSDWNRVGKRLLDADMLKIGDEHLFIKVPTDEAPVEGS